LCPNTSHRWEIVETLSSRGADFSPRLNYVSRNGLHSPQ
jgi:hypothetical protein